MVSALLVAAFTAAAASQSSAQTFQGSLRGSVKDAQGVVPAATVMLINEQTKVSRQTVTNAEGEYVFPAVDPGTYTVRANVSGFKTYEQKGVRIGTQQALTLDVGLEVGTLEETVTVTGEVTLIETATASTGETLEKKSLEQLPTIGRNVFLMRFGWNQFDDNNNLPFPFDAHTLGFNPAFADAMPLQKFPALTLTGYNGTGFTGMSDRKYYSYGFNGTINKLFGAHSLEVGADYRFIGVDALSYGQSAGDFTFNGTFTQGPNALSPTAATGNAVADLLLDEHAVVRRLREHVLRQRPVRPGDDAGELLAVDADDSAIPVVEHQKFTMKNEAVKGLIKKLHAFTLHGEPFRYVDVNCVNAPTRCRTTARIPVPWQ
jgi:hypothetical protein